jgi:mono/diheme cytochrome c family protein
VRRAIGIGGLLLLCLNATVAAQNEDGQPTKMPPLPPDVTLGMVRSGDSVFHGKGHCFACHGAEAEGLPNAGSALTLSLNFIPTEIAAID